MYCKAVLLMVELTTSIARTEQDLNENWVFIASLTNSGPTFIKHKKYLTTSEST